MTTLWPTLTVADVDVSLAFYSEKLGFKSDLVTIQGSVQTDSIGVPCGACRGRRAGAARTHRSG